MAPRRELLRDIIQIKKGKKVTILYFATLVSGTEIE
jgi:hypothetical protein